MVIFCSLPVPRSLAETFMMPLASMSKVTSTWGTPRGAGGMPDEMEDADRLVVPGHLPLALEHLDLDGGLVVRRRREGLALLGRDRRVALDQPRRDAAERLDAERERRDVEQQQVLDVAGQHASLDRGADRHDLVRVDALVGILAEELLDELLDARHARLAADQHDLVDVLGLEARVLHGLLARPDRLLDDVLDQLLELRARQLELQVLGTGGVRRDEREVDLGLHRRWTARSWPSPRPP